MLGEPILVGLPQSTDVLLIKTQPRGEEERNELHCPVPPHTPSVAQVGELPNEVVAHHSMPHIVCPLP